MGRVTLRLAGLCSGTIHMDSDTQTIADVCAKVGDLRGSPDTPLKLLWKGRIITKDMSSTISELALGENSKLIVMKGAVAAAGLNGPSSHSAGTPAASPPQTTGRKDTEVQDLLQAIEALSARRPSLNRYAFELANQDDQKINLSVDAKQLLTSALALHQQGRDALERGECAQALELLQLSERAFDAIDLSCIGHIDNVGLMLLDLVWCAYKLQDVDRLAISSRRLKRARSELHRAYGPGLTRLRTLHPGVSAEAPILLRLEVLGALVARFNNDRVTCRQCLAAAEVHARALHVDDSAVATMAELGVHGKQARRALRFCNGDVSAALNFCEGERRRHAARQAEAAREGERRRLQASLGRTLQQRSRIDVDILERLEELSFPRAVAVEALRRSENVLEDALLLLGEPAGRGELEDAAAARAQRRASSRPGSPPRRRSGRAGSPSDVDQALVGQLCGEGYEEYYVRWALKKCNGSASRSRSALVHWGPKTRCDAAGRARGSQSETLGEEPGEGSTEAAGATGGASGSGDAHGAEDGDLDAGEAAAAGDEPGAQPEAGGGQESSGEESDSEEEHGEVDEEVQSMLTSRVAREAEDPFSCYDLDVSEEMEALHECARWAESEDAQGGC